MEQNSGLVYYCKLCFPALKKLAHAIPFKRTIGTHQCRGRRLCIEKNIIVADYTSRTWSGFRYEYIISHWKFHSFMEYMISLFQESGIAGYILDYLNEDGGITIPLYGPCVKEITALKVVKLPSEDLSASFY